MNFKSVAILPIVLLSTLVGIAQVANTEAVSFEPLEEGIQRSYFAGRNHLIKGDLEKAYNSFQVCAEAEPEVAAFQYEVGKIELELGKIESAHSYLRSACDLDPDNDWYHYYKGLCNLELENLDEAWADLALWMAARPSDLESLFHSAEFFIDKGEFYHAYMMYSYYEDEIAHNVEVRKIRLILIESADLKPSKHLKFINDAIRDFPEEAEFKHELGRYYAVVGDLKRASGIFQEVIEEYPEYLLAYMSLAKCHMNLETGEDIFPLLKKAFTSEDIDPSDMLNSLLGLKKESEVDALIPLALNSHPEDARLHHFDGIRHAQFNRFEEAAKSYETAIKFNPHAFEIREELLYILLNLGDWEKMVEVGEKAAISFPLEPVFNYYLGLGLSKKGKKKEAVKAYKNGLAVLYDDDVLAGIMTEELAMCYRDLGEYEKSYSAFEECLAYNDSPYVKNNYAYFLATDRAEINRALELSTEANEAILDEPNFLDTHALILHLLNRNEEALELILKAQTLLPADLFPDAVYSEREGDILWELGRHDEARLKWEEAVGAGGGKKRLNEKLNRVVE